MTADTPKEAAEQLRERAERLHEEAIVVLAHDHLAGLDDLRLMLAGGVTAKVLHVSLDVLVWEEAGTRYRESCEDWRGQGFAARARDTISRLREHVSANSDWLRLILRADDLRQAKASGQAGLILGSEGSKLLEGSLERLQEFHDLGLRVMQLTWAVPNLVVDPDARDSDSGLTPFGRQLVKEMHRLGMVVDVAHLVYLSRKAFFEAIDLAEAPVLAGHCTAQAISPGGEVDDERLRAIAATGGVVAIHFCRHIVRSSARHTQDLDADLDDVVDNVAYIADQVGIDHVALGPDYFLNDALYARAMGSRVEWVRGCESAAELASVTHALLRRGFSQEETKQVLGGNLLRLFEQVWRG